MQKKLKSLLAVACLVSATAMFFIACGDGEMIKLTADEIKDLTEVEGTLDYEIGKIVTDIQNGGGTSNPGPGVSSSTTPPPPPPSSPGPGVSSSTTPPPPSSPGPGVSSSSRTSGVSSSTAPPPSSAAPPPSASSGNKCVEENPRSGFTCSWDKTTGLTPGYMLKPANSAAPSGCTVAWHYAYGDQLPILPVEFRSNCFPLDNAGVKADGGRAYALVANLTCGTSTHKNVCTPSVLAGDAPYLDGACKWDKNPPTVPAARGSIPSGVTAVDKDKVCGVGSTPSVVYKYDGGAKTWPANGIVPVGEYKDVKAYLSNCPNYPGAASVTSDCGTLTVVAGSDHVIELECEGVDKGDLAKCKGTNKATLKPEECLDLTVLHYTGDPRPAKASCRVVTGNDGKASYKFGGVNGQISGYFDAIDIGTFKNGENNFGTLCLISGGNIECEIAKY